MDSDRYRFISLARPPERLTPEESAWFLGFAAHDIPVLIRHGLLKPLGNPPPNGGRYFAISDLETLRTDRKWLDRASATLIRHWKTKNESKRTTTKNLCSADRVRVQSSKEQFCFNTAI